MSWREVFREPMFRRVFRGGLTIICTAEGFTVRAAGRAPAGYRWTQVVRTAYRPGGYFVVETAAGAAFAVGSENRWFKELIAICNAMTPHLPYVWMPQSGNLIGPIPYTAVPRDCLPSPATGH